MFNDEKPISDQYFYDLAHPLLSRRFYLALVFSIILFPVIAVGLIAGTIFMVVPLFALILWITNRVLFAGLVGNSVVVSSINYPRVNDIAENLKLKIDYKKKIYIFVYEQGDFNASMSYLFFRRAIFINSELLESGVSDPEISWIIARFIGYLRARQQAGVLGSVIRAAQHLGIFNLFILPYERAMVYTGDRIAIAAVGGDISSAVSAMQKLLVGRQLGYSVNPEGLIEQRRMLRGSFFAFLARIMSSFPPLVSRFVDVIVFAKEFFPAQYAAFETANPGLPVDLALLTQLPNFKPKSQQREVSSLVSFRWMWAAVIATAVFSIGFLGWRQYNVGMDGAKNLVSSVDSNSSDSSVAKASPEPVDSDYDRISKLESPTTTPPSQVAADTSMIDCDRLAAAPNDPDRAEGVTGVPLNQIDVEAAVVACQSASANYPNERRYKTQLGRALYAGERYSDALEPFRSAAAAGSVVSMHNLGKMYYHGRGVGKNFAEAGRLWSKAAEAGYGDSIFAMAGMYEDGRLGRKDIDLALKYYRMAEQRGVPSAKGKIEQLSKQANR